MPNEQREHQSAAGLFIHDLDAVRADAPDAAALGLIMAGHRADDGETDWPAAPWS